MARKLENAYIDRVHKHLKGKIHYEKMCNPFRRGTADCWYSGLKGDLWVEYKYQKTPLTIGALHRLKLEPLQTKWISDRQAEGRRVLVILGSPSGAAIVKEPAERILTSFLHSPSGVAAHILNLTA